MKRGTSLFRGGKLDSRKWKTQPEGTPGCNRLKVRKTRLTQQSSAMIIMLGGEAGRVAPIEHENGCRKETTAKKENPLYNLINYAYAKCASSKIRDALLFLQSASELCSAFVQPTCIRRRRKSISYIARSHVRGQAYMLDCKWHWIGLPAKEKGKKRAAEVRGRSRLRLSKPRRATGR
jgi:hypothetical protein